MRKKGVVLQKKSILHSGRYNEIMEEVRLNKVFVLGSCPLLCYSKNPRIRT